MADRVVNVKLRADASELTSSLVKAAAASRSLGDSASRSSQQVGAASDQAARKVAEVRRQLVDLGRTTAAPGVKVDTVAARMELSRLQSELADIDRSDASPRVDAETAAAEAQLRSVQSQLNRIDGQTVRATVEVNDAGATQRAASNMQTLWATAAAVSPAVGAIGAAAVAGLGGIATLAGSSAAGLGVLALGFSGVSDAVKLLDQRQEAVAANAAKGAASQVSSARQVEAAQASLANAQANAAASAISAQERVADAERNVNEARRDAAEGVASAQRRAAENVASAVRRQETAERSLGSAQRDVQRAQEDLTRARIDAAEELEDLQLRVRGGVLAERQAVLDLAEAQKALNEIPADASATDREQMVLDLERAKLRVDELKESNGDLSVQQSEWARTGVEGSRQVQDAQERVADAQRGVEDAARAVGEAAAAVDQARVQGAAEVARAERDGAEKIADAQRQVASAVRAQAEQQRQSAASVEAAQRAVEAAMESVGTTGVAALATIDSKLAEVGPSTMRFASFWTDSVQPALDRIRDTAAAGLLPGVQEGIESLLAQEPQITRFVDTYANSLGNLTRDSLANLSNPQWQRFWDMLKTQGVPQLESMWRSGDNLAESLANIMVAFAPLATDMGAGIEDLTERFATWSAGLSESEGFHEFEAYVRDNWPYIREIIANVADTIGDLLEAGAPIGSAYLQGFMLLTDVLSGLPVGVVQALLTAFLGYKAVQSVVGIVSGIANSMLALRTNITDLPDKVGSLTGSLSGGAAPVQRFGGFLDGAAGSSGRMSRALGGVTSALGGPWGLALGGATVVITQFTSAIADATSQEEKWAAGLVAGGQAAKDAFAGLAEERAKYGDNWLGDLSYNVDQFFGLASSMDEAREKARAMWEEMSPLQQAQSKVAEWQEILNRRMHDGSASAEEVRIAQERLTYWTGQVSGMQGELDVAMGKTNATILNQRTAYENMVGSASAQLGIYNTLLQDKATKEAESAASTEGSMGSASTSWQDHVADVDVSLDEYAARLDEDVANKDAWREDIKAVTERGGVEVGAALLAMGEEGKRLADDMANATDEDFRRMADAMVNHARNGGAQAAWEMDQAMKIMSIVSRDGSAASARSIAEELGIGVADAARIAHEYGIAVAGGINPVLTGLGKPPVAVGQMHYKPGYKIPMMAEGGVVPGQYVGPKADNVLIRANPREFMQPVAAVQHYGTDFMEAVRTRRFPKEIAGYAEGGLVGFGRRLQGMGATVSRHSAFDGRTPTSGHGATSLHYTDNAIDVNTRPGTSALEQRELAPMAALARSLGFRTIFMSAGHYNHLHVDTGRGGSIGSAGAMAPAVVLPKPPGMGKYRTPISDPGDAGMQKIYDEATAWLAANTGTESGASSAAPPGAGVERWRPTVMQALARVGQSASLADTTLRRMNQESGGNPRAINNWDINATRGTPSKGLMQVIDPTFRANRDPGLVNDIWDPMANIVASMRYTLNRYGSLPAGYNRKGGYDSGGIASGVGFMPKNTLEPERVLSPRQTEAFEQMVAREFSGASGGAGGPITISVEAAPVRIYLDGQEWRGMARVEAETVVHQRDAARGRDWRSARA